MTETDWKIDRARWWNEEFQPKMYNQENEAKPKFAYTVYTLRVERHSYELARWQPFLLYVGVYEDGLIQMDSHTYWFGKKWDEMSWDEKREVYDYLTEWEFAAWVAIGPEDSELFATEKLTNGS